jgi:hypothetical protein
MRGDDDRAVGQAAVSADNAILYGAVVYAASGERLGFVEASIADPASGNSTFVIVTRRRLFGLRVDRHILPRASLVADSGERRFVVQLHGAPAYQSVATAAEVTPEVTPVSAPSTVEPAPAVVEVALATVEPRPATMEPAPAGPAFLRLDPARGD